MKKTIRRILCILLIAVMVIASYGCKKKDQSEKGNTIKTDITEPTPTPVPAVTMEDLFEIQKENVEKYTKLVKTINEDRDIEIPDVSILSDLKLKFTLDMMGNGPMNAEVNGTVDLRSFSNIAHMIVEANTQGNISQDTENNNKRLEVYVDNTSDDDTIKIYESEEEGVWKLVEKSVREVFEQYANIENNAGQNTDTQEKKYFKDFDEFLKKHTVMEEADGVFRNTTSFTIPEFRVYYRNDINAWVSDLADSIMTGIGSILAGDEANAKSLAATVTNLLNECINGMTGEIRLVQEFNSELEPTVMTFNVSKLAVNLNSGIKLALDVDELSISLTNRDDIEPIVIPQEVKDNAVSDTSSNGEFGSGSSIF